MDIPNNWETDGFIHVLLIKGEKFASFTLTEEDAYSDMRFKLCCYELANARTESAI